MGQTNFMPFGNQTGCLELIGNSEFGTERDSSAQLSQTSRFWLILDGGVLSGLALVLWWVVGM